MLLLVKSFHRRYAHVRQDLTGLCLTMQDARAKLSQDLVALWADEYGAALALLRRIFPPGLMRFLNIQRPVASPPDISKNVSALESVERVTSPPPQRPRRPGSAQSPKVPMPGAKGGMPGSTTPAADVNQPPLLATDPNTITSPRPAPLVATTAGTPLPLHPAPGITAGPKPAGQTPAASGTVMR